MGHQYCSGELTYFSLSPLLLSFAHGCWSERKKDRDTDKGKGQRVEEGGGKCGVGGMKGEKRKEEGGAERTREKEIST